MVIPIDSSVQMNESNSRLSADVRDVARGPDLGPLVAANQVSAHNQVMSEAVWSRPTRVEHVLRSSRLGTHGAITLPAAHRRKPVRSGREDRVFPDHSLQYGP